MSANSGDSQPTPPRTAHPTGDHVDTARRGRQRSRPRHPRACRSPPRHQHPRDSISTEALLLLSRADQRSFTRELVDLSLIAEEATERFPPRRKTRPQHRDLRRRDLHHRSHALLLQMTTNLVHNAIVHNLPGEGTVWVTTSVRPDAVVLLGREHRRDARPTVGVHARRAVSARHRTHTHRPRRRWPRPGDRQKHHPGPRRNPDPHPAPMAGPCHSATTCPLTHGQMTIHSSLLRRRNSSGTARVPRC